MTNYILVHEDNLLKEKPQYRYVKKLANGVCVLPMSAIRFLNGVDGISVRTEHEVEMLEIELKEQAAAASLAVSQHDEQEDFPSGYDAEIEETEVEEYVEESPSDDVADEEDSASEEDGEVEVNETNIEEE